MPALWAMQSSKTPNFRLPNSSWSVTVDLLDTLCGERQPWRVEYMAFVFREIFKAPPTDAQKANDAILAYARKWPIVIAK